MSYHLMGTLEAQGLSPCSFIRSLGRSQLQGRPVCKHGVGLWLGIEVGSEGGPPDLHLLCMAWVEPRSVTCPRTAKCSWPVGLPWGSPMMSSEVAPVETVW